MSDFSAKIKAILDTKDIPQQIKGIEKNTITLRSFKLDTSKLISELQSSINKAKFTISLDNSNIARQAQQSGSAAGKSFSNAFNSAATVKTSTNNAENTIRHMQQTLANLKFDRSSIDLVTKDLENMSLAISNVTTRISNNSLNLSIRGVDELGRAVTIVKQFDHESGSISTIGKTISQSFDTGVESAKRLETATRKVTEAINSGAIDASIAKVRAQYDMLGSSAHSSLQQTATDIQTLETLQKRLGTETDNKKLVQTYEEYEQVLAKVKNGMSAYSAVARDAAKEQDVLSKSSTLSNKIAAWMNNNTKAAEIYGSTLRELQSQLQNNTDPSVLKEVSLRFAEIDSQAKAAKLTTSSFSSSLKNVVLQTAGLTSAAMALSKVVNLIKEGIKTVVELDTALVDLQKTTTMSASELSRFYYDANKSAKKLGVTTQEIIQSAADWSRLGYSDKDSATLMAGLSAQFNAISPGTSIDEATKGLVSMMKAYDIEAEDVLDSIMSKINIIGNTAATSNAEIIEGLQDSSAAMAAMGSTLEENIALFTAAQEITQDASKVGNALRSISMRIRGYDEETEQLSEDLANITGEVIDLTKTASNPNGISLFTDESQTEYKSVYQYLHDISEVYGELDAKSQQNLMEKLFGKNRASIGQAILQNMEAADKALDNMANSAGSAENEMSIIMDSLDYKLNRLSETGTSVAQNLFKREDIKIIVDGLTSIMSIVDLLTDKIGLFGTIGLGAGMFAGIKNVGIDMLVAYRSNFYCFEFTDSIALLSDTIV